MSENEFRISKDYQTVIGDFQKVGIRPVIDARERGVRESPEKQTRAIWGFNGTERLGALWHA